MTGNTKLENPEVAYAYAGFDKDFTLFRMTTKPLQNKTTGEAGVLEVPYQGLLNDVLTSSDPVGWLKTAVRVMLGHSCKETGTMPHMWIVEFSPVFGDLPIPSHLFMDRPADQEWLRA